MELIKMANAYSIDGENIEPITVLSIIAKYEATK